jgi:hypothetical protein
MYFAFIVYIHELHTYTLKNYSASHQEGGYSLGSVHKTTERKNDT